MCLTCVVSPIAFQWLDQKSVYLIYLIYVTHSHPNLIKYMGPGKALCGDFECLSEGKGITSITSLTGIFK